MGDINKKKLKQANIPLNPGQKQTYQNINLKEKGMRASHVCQKGQNKNGKTT